MVFILPDLLNPLKHWVWPCETLLPSGNVGASLFYEWHQYLLLFKKKKFWETCIVLFSSGSRFESGGGGSAGVVSAFPLVCIVGDVVSCN